jgi:hypothetical protein
MLWRVFLVVAVLAVVLGAVDAWAALIDVKPDHLAAFSFPANLPAPVPAIVDIKPETLQKTSKGQPVTVYIELPPGYDVHDISVDSVRFCYMTGSIAHDGAPGAKPEIGDYDHDGIPDLKITFGRGEVINLVSGVATPSAVTFTIMGMVGQDGFSGSDMVKLLDP